MAELVREIVIDARPETIFPFLIDSEQHKRWEGTDVELDPRPGGVYSVLIAGAFRARGEFVEVIPNEKVVFTFGWDAPGNPITPGSTTVEIALTSEGEKTRLVMTHRDLPADAVGDHQNGWDHYLARLSVAATGGDAGPDVPPGDM